ncbi:MAG: filamentous hemagglutinin N-terminal domain-containing protein [Gloeotrichia echinulata GP01]
MTNNPTLAQITPDGTLGNENSRVTRDVIVERIVDWFSDEVEERTVDVDLIEGGASRGSNLFHSFSQFNVNEGQRVYFNNPTGIQNIFSRVTGNSVSNILGTLGVNGGANLFLLNPNGILFGPNAKLDLQGSFLATTANALQFGNLGSFSATDQNVPSDLLTISPSALLFNQINQNAKIENNSTAAAGINPAGWDAFGLRVPDGKSLLLVGGNVRMDGGKLNAYGGRVELGGLAAPGSINLVVDGDNLKLEFPENVARADVSLTNGAGVYVEGNGGGNITVNARNLEILGGSSFSAGIGSGLGTPETVAGDITLNATGEIKVADSGSQIINEVRERAKGKAGNITIDTGSLSLVDGARLSTSTLGRGNAGNVRVEAKDTVSLSSSRIFSTVEEGSVGNAGNIDIDASSLKLTDDAQVSTSTLGTGNAGNVTVKAKDDVYLAGNRSAILSQVRPTAVGNAGNIDINATSLTVTDGARVNAQTRGKGDGGNININIRNTWILQRGQITPDGTLGNENSRVTRDVIVKGSIADLIEGGASRGSNLFHSFSQFNVNEGQNVYFNNPTGIQNIFSRVTGNSVSNILGTLGVNGGANLFLLNPNGILFGPNAELDLQGSFLATTANALQFGNLGSFSATDQNVPSDLLTISPSALLFNQINQNAKIENNSTAAAGINPAGWDAFGLRVPDGKSLLLVGGNVRMDGGKLNAYGGRVELGGLAAPGSINLVVDGDNLKLEFPENVARANVSLTNKAGVYVQANGGGNIAVNARNLEILGGSSFSAGIGSGLGTPETVAGDITLNATGEIKVADSGSQIINEVRERAKGKAGNITINTGSLSLVDGGQFSTSTWGQGNAGNVRVEATGAVFLSNSKILTTAQNYVYFIDYTGVFIRIVESTGVGNPGDININASSLKLTDRAELATSTSGQGNAGNVTVTATGAVSLSNSWIFSEVKERTYGNGGKIDINASSLTLTNGSISTSISGQGNAGNVTVTAKDAVSLSNSKILSTADTYDYGNAGNIDINATSFTLTDGTELSTSTKGQGNAGNVRVEAKDAVSLSNSAIFSRVAPTAVGNAGNIDINATSLTVTDDAQVNAQTQGKGDGGNITINTRNTLMLQTGKIISTAAETALGKAGTIQISSPTIYLRNNAQINAQADNGNRGEIKIATRNLRLRNNSLITASAGSTNKPGDGGIIDIDARGGFVIAVPSENSDIIANAFGGKGGTINISANRVIGFQNRGKLSLDELKAIPTNGTSDISASSDVGQDGQVSIDTLNTDPTQGLVLLPTDLADLSGLIVSACGPGNGRVAKEESRFVITGRGGLPASPDDALTAEVVSVNWVTRDLNKSSNNQEKNPVVEAKLMEVSSPATTPLVEAVGMIRNSDGDIVLTAQPMTSSQLRSGLSNQLCGIGQN